MTNKQHDNKLKAANRVLQIREEILDLINEAQRLAEAHIESKNTRANLDAYVFDQLTEHLEKSNPYNQDLGDVVKAITDDSEQED